MQNYTSTHFKIWARLLRRPKQCQTLYLQGRRAFMIKLSPDPVEGYIYIVDINTRLRVG